MDGDSIEGRLRDVEVAQSKHEAVCVERYTNILGTHKSMKDDMAELRSILLKIGYGLMAGMALILAHQMFFK